MRKRVCLCCGKEISFFKSIIYNNCCSYECDISFEDNSKIDDKKEKLKNEKSNYSKEDFFDDDIDFSNESLENEDEEDSLEEFFNYCLEDDNEDLDDTY